MQVDHQSPVYFITSGSVEVTGRGGKVSIRGRNQILAEEALLVGQPSCNVAVAREPTNCLRIRRVALQDVFRSTRSVVPMLPMLL